MWAWAPSGVWGEANVNHIVFCLIAIYLFLRFSFSLIIASSLGLPVCNKVQRLFHYVFGSLWKEGIRHSYLDINSGKKAGSRCVTSLPSASPKVFVQNLIVTCWTRVPKKSCINFENPSLRGIDVGDSFFRCLFTSVWIPSLSWFYIWNSRGNVAVKTMQNGMAQYCALFGCYNTWKYELCLNPFQHTGKGEEFRGACGWKVEA